MELSLKKHNDVFLVEVKGEMDLYNASKLKELFMGLLKKEIKKLIVDMNEVEYLDSSGVGVLIHICNTAAKSKVRFAMANIHGSVKKVIELTRLTDYFPIAASVQEATKVVGE